MHQQLPACARSSTKHPHTYPIACAVPLRKPHHDGFPSPVGSPGPGGALFPPTALGDGDFIETALGETGTNPYFVSGEHWGGG